MHTFFNLLLPVLFICSVAVLFYSIGSLTGGNNKQANSARPKKMFLIILSSVFILGSLIYFQDKSGKLITKKENAKSKINDSSLNKIQPSKEEIRIQNNPTSILQDSSTVTRENPPDSNVRVTNEKKLLALSMSILKAIKQRDYARLSRFIHPNLGVRFSLYAYVDSTNDKIISGKQIVELAKTQNKIKWAAEEETGQPMILSINNYFVKFVYDVDFLHAEKMAVNKFLGFGNSLNNLKELYPGCDFTEFYFSGFDPKYEGMDWRTLRLVFKKENGKIYLIGIIHDQWTI